MADEAKGADAPEPDQPDDAPVVDAEVVPDDAGGASPEAAAAARATPAPSQSLERRPPQGTTTLIQAKDPAELVQKARDVATALNDVIVQQGLRTKMGRRKKVRPDGSEEWIDGWHINVEGWQTTATLLGLAVVSGDVVPVTNPVTGEVLTRKFEVTKEFYPRGTKGGEIRNGSAQPDRVEKYTVEGYDWTCRTEVYKDGTLLATGSGLCSRTERTWLDRDEHSLMSMAQTRSIGRAVASAARWIVALAGYSGTPAEEMPKDDGPLEGTETAPSGEVVRWWAKPMADEKKSSMVAALAYVCDVGDGPNEGAAMEVINELKKKLAADPDKGGVEFIPQAVWLAVGVVAKKLKEMEPPDPDETAPQPTAAEIDAARAAASQAGTPEFDDPPAEQKDGGS